MTPAEAKKFVEECNARADRDARERHGNKRLNQNRQLVPLDDPKKEAIEEKKDDE